MIDLSLIGPTQDEPDSAVSWDAAHRWYTNHCNCGRFAKFRGRVGHYNGAYYSEGVELTCGRCGDITVWLV